MIEGNTVNPRRERGISAKAADAAIQAYEYFLCQVFGVGFIGYVASHQAMHVGTVGIEKLLKGAPVSLCDALR
jgi:hypothetical protein